MPKWIMKIPLVISTTTMELTEEEKDKVVSAANEGKSLVEINDNRWVTTNFIALEKIEVGIN